MTQATNNTLSNKFAASISGGELMANLEFHKWASRGAAALGSAMLVIGVAGAMTTDSERAQACEKRLTQGQACTVADTRNLVEYRETDAMAHLGGGLLGVGILYGGLVAHTRRRLQVTAPPSA